MKSSSTSKPKKKVKSNPPTLKARIKKAIMSNTAKKVRIGDSLTYIITIKDLALIVNKSRNSILRYEAKGVFPPAPIRIGTSRYYRVEFCEKLCEYVDQFEGSIRPSAELIVQINQLFKEEREFLQENSIRLCQ